MERIQKINPERIAWCCAERGIIPADLESELGIAATSIERLMASEDGLTFNQLRKIAEYFGRGVLFFLEAGPVDETRVHTPEFRTLANQKPELSVQLKMLIERVERQREVYLGLCEDLDDIERPFFRAPDLSPQDPRGAAKVTRQWLGLTEENTFDTYRSALEARGVLVFRSNGYTGKWQIAKESPILGFTLYHPTCPVIVIKKQPWEPQQSFTLMHELGHILLHKSSSIDDAHDMQSHQGRERAANAFAGYLLVPDVLLSKINDAERPTEISLYDDWLAPYRKTWGVSGEVILRRLLDAGRLTQHQYGTYRQWRAEAVSMSESRGNRMYRYREPKHVFGDTFVRTVLDALTARHISLAKASSYLDSLKIKDLHQLERFYGGL